MSRLKKKNLNSIKRIFEERTGAELETGHRAQPHSPVQKLMILAAAVVTCLALAAFTYPLFSPLDGDELALSATYEGGGVVSIFVVNGSDKDLEFQKQTKLMNWGTGEEVERLDGEVTFENTKIPAHSSGIMTIDLSKAYDIEKLEMDGRNFEPYYLLLTNNNFLFGHDWICSFSFEDKERKNTYETQHHVAAVAETTAEIEEALRFYFEDSYQDETFAWNESNFTYLQKVDEIIKRFEGNIVSPVYPMIMVTGPSTFLDPHPAIREEVEGVIFDAAVPGEEQSRLINSDWTPLDGYRRLVGATTSEKALTVSACIPSANYDQGTSTIPLVYTFVYEASSAQNKENNAFIYGQFHSFEELEECKVYEDEYYVIYDVTDYLYTDLDAYIAYIQETREDLVIDDQIRQRIHNIYKYYKENLGELIYYRSIE